MQGALVIDEPNELAEDISLADQPEASADLTAPASDSSPDAGAEAVAAEPEVAESGVESSSEGGEEVAAAADSEATDSAEPQVAGGGVAEEEDDAKKDWYILKVQSNREKSISEALARRIKIEGLDDYFDQIVVPTEKVTEFKGGKKRIVNRKLYPGYIIVRMHINDDTWFVVRETPGIGDFTGSGGKPTPMLPHEVQRIIVTEEAEAEEAPKLKIGFQVGDRVKINEGTFESFEGEVSKVDQASGQITVLINIFGRSTPVELEYWQAESI